MTRNKLENSVNLSDPKFIQNIFNWAQVDISDKMRR